MKHTHNILTAKKTDGSDRAFFTKVGVALTNDEGKMVLKLNPGTVLDWRMTDSDEISVWVLPNLPFDGKPKPKATTAPSTSPEPPPLDDSDIPF